MLLNHSIFWEFRLAASAQSSGNSSSPLFLYVGNGAQVLPVGFWEEKISRWLPDEIFICSPTPATSRRILESYRRWLRHLVSLRFGSLQTQVARKFVDEDLYSRRGLLEGALIL